MPLLQMYLGDDFIDATFISPRQLEVEGFVEGARHELLEKHDEIIHLSEEKPSFFVELPSRQRLLMD